MLFLVLVGGQSCTTVCVQLRIADAPFLRYPSPPGYLLALPAVMNLKVRNHKAEAVDVRIVEHVYRAPRIED